MEFIEGSKGIYRPIRVLFDTPIYARILQICWHILSYKVQIAVLMELLRLQQKNQIPSQVTAEDMINLILEESKSTLRECLWEFEFEDFDDEEAKPLLKLAWAVNVNNKMRDVECEARMLLNSLEAVPPNFHHPKVISTAQGFARILMAKQQEAPRSKRLCPSELVLEVVPRVLQGFLGLPNGPHLSMPSQQLSKMTVGVTKAVMDGVCSALTTEHQATFSCSVRDEMVLSVLTQIRQTWSPDVLVNEIDCLVPLLLSGIVQEAVGQICGLFQPHGPKVQSHLTATTVTTPVQDDSNLTVTEQQPTASPETDCAALPPPPASPTPPAGPLSTTDVQTREDLNEKPSPKKDLEPPAKEPAFGAVPPPLTPPAEPSSVRIQTTEDVNPKPGMEKDPEEPTTEAYSNVVPVPPSSPSAEPPSKFKAREDVEVMPSPKTDPDTTEESGSAAVQVNLKASTELSSIRIQANGDVVKPSLERDPEEPTTEAESKVATVPPSLPSSKVQAREDVKVMPSPKTDPATTKEPGSAAVPTELPSFRIQANRDVVIKTSLEKDPEHTRGPDSAVVQGSLTGTLKSLVIITAQNGLTAILAEKEQLNISQETNPAVVSPPPAGRTSTTQPSSISDVWEEEENNTIPTPTREHTSAVGPASASALNLPLEPGVIVKVHSEDRKTRKEAISALLPLALQTTTMLLQSQ